MILFDLAGAVGRGKFCEAIHLYLYGQCFLIRTDHGALKYLFSFKDPQGQMARWLQVLDTYGFEIEHREEAWEC